MTRELPPLDCHAHIAPDVTPTQVRALEPAWVFAVTRSLAESSYVATRQDLNLIWGVGCHPASASARNTFDETEFRRLLPNFAFIGEIGLDRRAGAMADQKKILRTILGAAQEEPLLLSVHSAGATSAVVNELADNPHPGIILHWFRGTTNDLSRAAPFDPFFSVNAAMTDVELGALDPARVLTETDFPARRTSARRPGQIAPIERKLATIWGRNVYEVRFQVWTNLRVLTARAGVLDKLPDALADQLLEI
ncbi:TatD family hydrolase [Rhodococcus sp. NCIMB 12038]|uniref:TatD family hydrolase n=1 Tax=Rhodococcus sp. NCIMB 12038 TaxID=933800 RepID=UPI000B3C602D|nr:TatD family hydrolase [Rhodococcus sp. NCIMB 12038]OUS91937.1 hypothetical protein CA951_31195 [Rhodococcus sp. NCIMB 12038]